MRDLDDHSRAVTGLKVAADRSAVDKIAKDLDTVTDDLVGPLPVNFYNKTDAAGIVFLTRMI
jgi:hypothetical protein